MVDFIGNLPKHVQLDILNQRCIGNIRDRLRVMGFDPDEFIQKMIAQKAIIAGSIVLSCMLSEVYPHQDIDIYLQTKQKGYRIVEPFEEYLFGVTQYSCAKNGYSLLRNIKYTRSFTKYLETIVLDMDPTKFVIQNFDLSFCKLIFDGYTIRFYPWRDNPYPLFDYSMIFRKCGFLVKLPNIHPFYFNGYYDLYNLVAGYSANHTRFNFYRNSKFPKIPVNDLLWEDERGDLITDLESPACIIFWIYIKACDRIQKYQKRGFTVYGF